MTQLWTPAHEMEILPALSNNSLMRGKVLSDNVYTTIFRPFDESITVPDKDVVQIIVTKKALLQVWQNKHCLWCIPLVDTINNIQDGIITLDHSTPSQTILNIYELPSTETVIWYLHATLGFPTKATWIKALNNGKLTMFSGMTVKAMSKFFPKSNEIQKDHMLQQQQNVCLTKSPVNNSPTEQHILTPGKKCGNIYLHVSHSTKKTMNVDQTGCFPFTLIRGINIEWLQWN